MVNGTLHLMSSHLDHAPCIVDTMLSVSHAAWHPAGNVLAVAGASRVTQSEQNTNVVRFYSSTGTFLHQLRIPRSKVIQGARAARSAARCSRLRHLVLPGICTPGLTSLSSCR